MDNPPDKYYEIFQMIGRMVLNMMYRGCRTTHIFIYTYSAVMDDEITDCIMDRVNGAGYLWRHASSSPIYIDEVMVYRHAVLIYRKLTHEK